MATKRKRRTTSSNSPLEDILGGIAGASTRRRSRKPTVGGITGSKASSSIFLTLAAICFAVGYYVPEFQWLIYVGIALAVVYLIVTYFKKRKKEKKEEAPAVTTTKPASKTEPAPAPAAPESHMSESQRAQLQDRLATHPELQQLHPKFADAAKVVVHKRAASKEVLTTTLKLSDDDAGQVLRQLELVGIVGGAQPTGEHSVYVTDEAELAEWLKLVLQS